MFARFDRLTPKLTLAIVLFAALMGTATALLVTYGFRHAQQTATSRSALGLEAQGRESLLRLTEREAQVAVDRFAQGAHVGQIAAGYLVAMTRLSGDVPWDVTRHLSRAPDGYYWDPDPTRRTDVFIPSTIKVGIPQRRDLRDSAAFDTLFPALLSQVQDAAAIYYVSPNAVMRYYSAIPGPNIAQLLGPTYPLLQDPSYVGATPVANPTHATVWRTPYLDPAQGRLLVTASTPIYAGNAFRGVVGVDVSLAGLIYHLNTLKPTSTGYAFLLDRNGGLIAAPASALPDLVGRDALPPAITPSTILGLSLADAPNPALRRIVAAMRAGRQGIGSITLGGRPVFVSYAHLGDLGWSLGLVAPIAEITRQSAGVAAAIEADANAATLRTLTILGLLFALLALATLLFSRWLLVRPIGVLTSATRAVAAGDLSVTIPVTRRDELGQLARSFNAMSGKLAQSYEVLEQRVQERTRELSTLLDVSYTVTSTLELTPLLSLILDQLRSLVPYSGAAILTVDGGDLVILDYHGAAPRERAVGIRFPLAGAVPHEEVIRERKPIIVADMQNDSPVSRAFRQTTGQSWSSTLGYIRSWMGVPLVLKERVIGMLALIHSQPGYYTAHHADLATVIAAHAAAAIENANLYAQAHELAAFHERSRLARELHDSVTQALFAMTLHARTAQMAVERDGVPREGKLGRSVYQLSELTQGALAEMRALIFELRPGALADEGLATALRKQAAAIAAREGLAVEVEAPDERLDLDAATEEHLYRLAQEALHNVVKHAQAGRSSVRLYVEPAGGTLVLEIGDDGVGFDPTAPHPGHLGLGTMAERARQIGGTIQIVSAPGEGTTVRVVVPGAIAASTGADVSVAGRG